MCVFPSNNVGRLTTTRFNALRQPVFVEDALGRILQMEWCRCGDIRKLFDGEGNETHWKRDVLGRVLEKRYADGRTEAMTFQPLSGRLATITDAKSQVKTARYNVDGTVAGVDYTAAAVSTPNVSFIYDAVYPRLQSMTDGIGTTLHTYHSVGVNGALRVATMDGPLAGTSDKARYTYDALGRTHTRNIGSGTTENLVTWDFDALGRLDATTSLLGVFDYAYVAQTDRLDRVDFPNGARTQFDYFAAGMDHRLKQIKHLAVAANPASIVSKFDYTYDSEGQKVGCEPEALSPIHHVKEGLPPTLIMHGKSDTTVPFVTVEAFTERMKKAGNRCELKGYDGKPHGFFNGVGFAETLAAADEFLMSLKYLPAK